MTSLFPARGAFIDTDDSLSARPESRKDARRPLGGFVKSAD